MVAYADETDVYRLAMRAPAFVPSPRIVTVDATSNAITLAAHGLSLDDELRFSLEGDPILGGPATSLPSPLSATTLYYAIPVGGDMFKVSTSAGGAAVDITSAGVGVVAILVSPVPVLRRLCAHWSAVVDGAAVGHNPPFERVDGAYHDEIVGVVARCAARSAIPVLGLNNPSFAADRQDVYSSRAYDEGRLNSWRSGATIRGAKDQTPTVAEGGARWEYLDTSGVYPMDGVV